MPEKDEATLYDLMEELDRLEELREDLEERGLRSLDDLERRIEELSRQIDALADDASPGPA